MTAHWLAAVYSFHGLHNDCLASARLEIEYDWVLPLQVSLQHLVKELGNYAPPKPLLKGMSSGGTVKSFNGSHNQLAGQGEFKHGADFGMEFAAVVNRQDPSSLRKTNQCSKGNPLAVAPDMKKIYADE